MTAPPALTLSAASLTTCEGAPTSAVSVSSNVADYDTYAWTPSATVSNAAGTSGVTFTPTASQSYTLSGSNSVTGCANNSKLTCNSCR